MQKLQKFKKIPFGNIPEEWKIVTFEEVSNRITYGFTNPIPRTENGPWLITAKDIKNGKINYETAEKTSWKAFKEELSDKSRPKKGTVLITKDGTLGEVAIIDRENICISQSVASVEPNDKISSEFLALSLQSPIIKKIIKVTSPATTIRHIYVTEIAKWNLGLPSIREQQKIASILSNVDELIQKIEQIIEQTQRLKKGLMQRLLTKGIGHSKFKKVALINSDVKQRQIPNEWEVKKIKDIGVINPESINEKYPDDEINYIEIGAISNYEIQEYVTHSLLKRPSRAQRIVKRGDIIVSTVRPYLKGFALITDQRSNLICSTGFAVIRPKNREDGNFIFNYIKSKLFEDNIFRHMEGMGYPAITSSDVADAIIPYPHDKKEMLKIGSILYNIDLSLKLKNLYKLELHRLKKGLMQQLLTGKIRVKV